MTKWTLSYFLTDINSANGSSGEEQHDQGDTSDFSSGSGHKDLGRNTVGTNRSRKDYIIAVEENAPMGRSYDPVFQLLKGLAKRTRGQMAVMDYAGKYRSRYQPYGYDEDSENEDDTSETNYEDSESDDDRPFSLAGRRGLIGKNILANFLERKLSADSERVGEREEARSYNTDSEDMEDNDNDDNAPPVVYEMDNDEQEDSPFNGNYGDRQSVFSDSENDDDDEDKKK